MKMKFFILGPHNAGFPDYYDDVIDDDLQGQDKVIARINTLINGEGWSVGEFLIIRGEEYQYVPPTDKGQLVKLKG